MSTNRQFALAVHMLVMLAFPGSDCVSSEVMAGSARANPVSMRRVLGRLREAGYVTSRPGAKGGSQLARDPDQITLADVWRTVYGDERLLGLYAGEPDCAVGSRIESMLLDVESGVRGAVEQELETTTIAQLTRQAVAEAQAA